MAGFNMRIPKKIGKILLWFVLGIIALPIVLLLLIILFILCLGRVKYNVEAQVGDDNSAHVEIRYFMRLIRVAISYAGGETQVRGRIAWVRIGEDKPKKKKKLRRRKSQKKRRAEAIDISIDSDKFTSLSDVIDYAKSERAKSKPDAEDDEAVDSTKTSVETKTSTSSDSSASQEKSPDPEADEKDSPSLLKQVKAVLTYPDLKTIIGLAFQCLHKFVKALKPKRLDISGVVGFDDPAATGWFMGAYEAATGVTGLRPYIRLLGSYHEKALRLDIVTYGRFRLGRLFTPFIWLYLKKPIRNLIHNHLLRKGEN